MTDYLAANWQEILAFNHLDSFESLWHLQADWFEEPNQRRGGWSGVSRVVLATPQGGTIAVFVKRQENHLRKTRTHPLKGIPTFRAEIDNILKLQQLDIPTMSPVYYAERKTDKGWQCILATVELTGFRPLDQVLDDWHAQGWAQKGDERKRLIAVAAATCANLHKQRLVHRALHAKHLFVNRESNSVCFIDLEKMRRTWTRRAAMLRDLDALNRHVDYVSATDRLRFLLIYLNKERADDETRAVWRELAKRARRKFAQSC